MKLRKYIGIIHKKEYLKITLFETVQGMYMRGYINMQTLEMRQF